MNIYQMFSRTTLMNYLDDFLEINKDWFNDLSGKLFGKRGKVRMHILDSINNRHPIENKEAPIIDCIHKYERYVLSKESIK
jgi:hypothetical protein